MINEKNGYSSMLANSIFSKIKMIFYYD